MATVKKEDCSCPRRMKAKCAHKPWKVTYREPGGRAGAQRTLSFKLKEEADAFAVKVERDKDLGVYINPRKAKTPFSEVWDQWLNTGSLEPSTYANYRSVYANHFEGHFARRPIGAVSTEDIAKWEQWEKEQGYKPYGIQVRKNLLSSVFGYAVASEIIGRNPCKTANPRKNESRSAYEPVSDEDIPETHEVLGIIAEMPKFLRAAVWAMAGCGLRPGEALAISDQSIEWESSTLLVNHQVAAHGICQITGSRRGVKRGTKHRKQAESRRTPIPGQVVEVFSDHIDMFGIWGDQGWLFESPRQPGRHPSYDWLLRQFKDAAKAAGVPQYTPKSLRHYFVTTSLHAGIPLYEIAQWMGHRDTRTTEQVYGHLTTKAFKRGSDALGEQLAGDLTSFRGKIDAPRLVSLDDEEAA
ncbi:tyrosine-type recombinase/integrase [Streptomyces thermocarboxydovorans]|uniref:tyrosine-type recombinase/integrase n=1 Tax=Streptomyces thermocarboxydovorans TaxID=59298 RepID=UPI0031D2C9B5